jgi:DNA-binding XRE family transcriptional regulator
MDKRRKPLTPHQQLQARLALPEQIARHPEWEFAHIVRYVRTALNLTLPEMAKVGRLSVPALKKIEAGASSPSLRTAERLLNPFGLRLGVAPKVLDTSLADP